MKEIISHFTSVDKIGDIKPVKVGLINDSYIVRNLNPNAPSWFLQRINHHVFQNVEGLQNNILKVTDHLRKKLAAEGETDLHRKVLRLVPTLNGQWFYRTPEGDYWRVYELIENASSHDKVTPQSAYLAGEAFGRFQCMLSDLPSAELVETIPNFHNIIFRLQQLKEAVAEDKVGQLAKYRHIVDDLLRREEEMCLAERLYKEGNLPKRINHCDTKVNNMMFDEDGKVLCIVDLDTVMPGFVICDFGDFMRTAANTGEEDDKNLDNVHVNMEIFEAYTRGYLKTATFLTDTEKELLPFGAKLMSYMQTVRFFTDFLNGDTYYKIQYPEHNLVRTLAQLRLLEEQEKEYDKMRELVKHLNK